MNDGMTAGDRGANELTPEEESEVTRLLAGAAGPEPMPDAVVARLRDVLDDLDAERSAERLGAARARRWPRALLAAAAVLVVGYGVVNVAGDASLSGSDSSASEALSATTDDAG